VCAMLEGYVWTRMTPFSVTCGQDPATSARRHHLLPRWTLISHVMAKVRVRMFATVREVACKSEWSVEARDLSDLLDKLGEEFGDKLDAMLKESYEDPDRLVILVNGRNAGWGRGHGVAFVDGDDVAIFPPVSGG
jgi:MoaD family protein